MAELTAAEKQELATALEAKRTTFKPGDTVYAVVCCGDTYDEYTEEGPARLMVAQGQLAATLYGTGHSPELRTYTFGS